MLNIPYASVVGCLQYLQICTRPDISFITGMLGRFQSNPHKPHWRAAKQVLRYFKKANALRLTFSNLGTFEMIGFSDADFAGDPNDNKSTSAYVFTLSRTPISWRSTKEKKTTTLTMQAEFLEIYEASNHALFLRNFVTELGLINLVQKPITLFCDNSVTICFIKNNNTSATSKHYELRHYAVLKEVEAGRIVVKYKNT